MPSLRCELKRVRIAACDGLDHLRHVRLCVILVIWANFRRNINVFHVDFLLHIFNQNIGHIVKAAGFTATYVKNTLDVLVLKHPQNKAGNVFYVNKVALLFAVFNVINM